MTAPTGPYQMLPPLSEELYAALYDDIRGAGVRVPIDVDEQGNILDGHHRKQIADELGIECPERVVRGLEEFAKVDYALTVNMARRHLSREERKALAIRSLRRDPRLSDREHARRCGVSHPFVAGLRLALEEAEHIDPVESRTRRGGGSYPTERAPRLETASNLGAEDHRADTPGDEGGSAPPAGAGNLQPAPAPTSPAPSRLQRQEETGGAGTPPDAGTSPVDVPATDPGVAAPAGSEPSSPEPGPFAAGGEREEAPDKTPVGVSSGSNLVDTPVGPMSPEVAAAAGADPHAAWKKRFFDAIVAARKVMRAEVEDVVRIADDEAVTELHRVARDLSSYSDRIAAARAATHDNVTPLRRVK